MRQDDSGAIGRRYRRQDAIGTPFCVTVDYDTKENNPVTLRDRDTMKQVRVAIEKLPSVTGTLVEGRRNFIRWYSVPAHRHSFFTTLQQYSLWVLPGSASAPGL